MAGQPIGPANPKGRAGAPLCEGSVFEVLDAGRAADAGVSLRFECQVCGSALSGDEPHLVGGPIGPETAATDGTV